MKNISSIWHSVCSWYDGIEPPEPLFNCKSAYHTYVISTEITNVVIYFAMYEKDFQNIGYGLVAKDLSGDPRELFILLLIISG